MPAAAVARWTPATAGMSGKCAGASGETAVVMPRVYRGPACAATRRLPRRPGWSFAGARRSCLRLGRSVLALPGRPALLGRLVEALDLRALAQLADELALRFAREIGLDLVLHLLELRRLLGALVLDLDDVPAELRLHRIGELARIHLERDLGELGHHLILGEIAKIAAFGGAGILGLFLGDGGEIGTALDLVEQRLGLVLAVDEDVARAHLLLPADGFHRVVVGLLQGLVVDGGLGL